MRLRCSLIPVIFVCSCSTTESGSGGSEVTDLNLAPGLDDWKCYLSDPGANMPDVWKVEDGILVCKGTPLGYLYSKEDYTNFVLELDWRWPAGNEPGKGGVLVRMTGGHKIWPKSLEAQINVGDAGDFWGLDGYQLSGPAERTRSMDHEKFGKLINVKKAKALEKPAGEWNHYEIVAIGQRVVLKINGQAVNEAAGCDVLPGKICLTAEGDEIHFRNLRLTAAGPR